MLESLNLYAGVASVLLPLVGGTWLFVKAGRSATSAVSGGMWMAIFSLIPIILFWIIADGVEKLIGFNIFPAAPVVVVMFFTLIAQPDGEKVWATDHTAFINRALPSHSAMKTYYGQGNGIMWFFVFFVPVFGTFFITETFSSVAKPGGSWTGLFFWVFGLAFFVWMEIAILASHVFRLEINASGILSIHALIRVVEEIPISGIKSIELPEGPYIGPAWNNWEYAFGQVIIEHGSRKTKLNRFPCDEDFVTQITLANPAVAVLRTDRGPTD